MMEHNRLIHDPHRFLAPIASSDADFHIPKARVIRLLFLFLLV
jgi:hypothetical protein